MFFPYVNKILKPSVMYPFVNTRLVIFPNHAKRNAVILTCLTRGLIFLLSSFFCVNLVFAQQRMAPPKKPPLRFPEKEIRSDFLDDQQKISRFLNQNQSAFKIDSTLVDTTVVLGRIVGGKGAWGWRADSIRVVRFQTDILRKCRTRYG